jgi:rubrerythrin
MFSHEFAAHLARSAELEAAAEPAFRRLRAELHELGAPRSLLRAASRAARDERRHARSMRALSLRHGARAQAPQIAARSARSLEAIATENAVEGCVRELYGALVATYQAEHAADVELRTRMRRIALEETRHAALSARVQRWLEQRLDAEARRRVVAARSEAVATLEREITRPMDEELAARAGLPLPHEARQLFARLLPLMQA